MSNSKKKIPKDHYVSQLYLDAFAIEGSGVDIPHIYQYMKDKIVAARIKDVASERHFYTVKDKVTGLDIRDIDNFFTEVENLVSIPLKKIIDSKLLKLEENEIELLASFFALMTVRTPGFINTQMSMTEEMIKEKIAIRSVNLDQLKKNYEEVGVVMGDKELEEQQKFILEKKYSVSFGNKGYFLAQGLDVSRDLARLYYKHKHWHILLSNSDRVFVTSDNPISIYRPVYLPSAMSAGYGNGTLFIPISPKIAILLRDFPLKEQIIRINRKQVEEFNKNTARFSTNYIFSNLKSEQIHQMYKKIDSREFQKTTVKHHKFAPYIFMGPPPVPEELLYD